jgi:large subunit ribosomal protein L10
MASEKVLNEKKEEVKKIEEKLRNSPSVVFTEYRGLDVYEMQELRKRLRENNVDYKVIKNTLARIAAGNLQLEELNEFLDGPTAVATAAEDLVAPARVLFDFSREHEALQLKGGILEGEIIGAERVKVLATLPTREILLAQLLGNLNSPIVGLMNVLNGPIRSLAVALSAIADQKEKAAQA